MVRTIKENLRVEKQGSIEIRHPDLTAGSDAEVIILIDTPAPAAGTGPEEAPRQPIWEVAAEIAGTVPDDVWKSVPTDLSKNLDHYFYGAPKDED
ncbi:MAG TPA: hypothetical protein VNJ70_09150 [Thermoanaerobaculia bacterium]|nr:hypothetical protein [Thermoanaerobaculia bacterium]